jgi:tetratricopeptide (TPR) repeat protein
LALGLFLLPVCLAWGGAEAPGEIINLEEKKFTGLVRWKSLTRVYIVKSGGGERGVASLELEVPEKAVRSLRIKEPAELAQADKLLQANNLPQAIAALDKLAQDYQMMIWDLKATRLLAEAYLRDGKADQAVRACERAFDKRKQLELSGEVAPLYWQALMAAGRSAKLEELLTQAAKSPVPEAQARANVLRGDMLRKQRKDKESLRDGYLRTVVLCRAETDPAVRLVRAEALYKAAQCLEEQREISRANELRILCRNEHSGTPWAARLEAGERN